MQNTGVPIFDISEFQRVADAADTLAWQVTICLSDSLHRYSLAIPATARSVLRPLHVGRGWAVYPSRICPLWLDQCFLSVARLRGFCNTVAHDAVSADLISVLPVVSMALTVLGTSAVIFAIIFTPTELKLKPLCALVVLLIPSDPEVLGVGEYIFWWAGILLLLALVWQPDAGDTVLRYFMIVFGGLSAPIIVPMASLMLLRAWVYRAHRTEIIAGVLATSVALIQIVVMLTTTSAIPGSSSFALPDIVFIIRKFFGLYAAYPFHSDVVLIVGTILILMIATACRSLGTAYQLLAAMLVLVIVTIAVRIPVAVIDPFVAGPRYFFYPFVIIAWLTLWIAASHADLLVRSGAGLAIMAATVITLSSEGFSRRHDPIDWKEHVKACMKSETYDFPIQFDGSASSAWKIKLSGQACRDLAKGSLI